MMITGIENYFTKGCGRCDRLATPDCSTRHWASGLADLRRICRMAGLVEVVQWARPWYRHAGRNIALIGAFRDDFRLKMMNAALLADSVSILEQPGFNAGHANMIRFTADDQPARMEAVIRSCLRVTMADAEAGLSPPKDSTDVGLPDELVGALDADTDMAEAFAALTPGRQRSYVIHLAGAKTQATRVARILKARDRIFAGKGARER